MSHPCGAARIADAPDAALEYEDRDGVARYPQTVLDAAADEFDFANGTNRVWYGWLCGAEVGEDGRPRLELRDFDDEWHSFEAQPFRADELRASLGKPIQASCWETVDDQGNVKAVLYFMRRLSPPEIPFAGPKQRLREFAAEHEGEYAPTGAEFVAMVKDLLPTREAALRFGRNLEEMRGRKIYDD